MHTPNELIQDIFRLCREMIILADQGHEAAREDGCRLLFSVLQDCAYKLRHEAEREREAHRLAGAWSEPDRNGEVLNHHSVKEEFDMGCKACDKKEGLTEEQRSLLAALSARQAPAASKEIADVSGLDAKMVSNGLKTLKAKGYVDSPARCRYAITETGKAALN